MKAVIEVGANEGQDTDRFIVEYPETYIYAFEPIPRLYADLSERYRDNPWVRIFPMAVTITNGFLPFNISETADWGCSSLHNFAPDIHEKWSQPWFNFTRRIVVPTIRLDHFMYLSGITSVEYLHIDAQGNDLNVLKSLGSSIYSVKAGVCEAGQTIELYDVEGNNVPTVRKYLEDRGFKVRIEDDGVGKPAATITGHEANIFFNR